MSVKSFFVWGQAVFRKEKKENCFFTLHFFLPCLPLAFLLLALHLSFEPRAETTKMASEQQQDPYALHADGTAVDPHAFRAAALADASLAEDLKKDERASRVLASRDDAALQELLKEVHQVRFLLIEKGKRRWEAGENGERRRRAEERGRGRKKPPPPLFFIVRFVVFRSRTFSLDISEHKKQEESRRAERESRAMSERTIDAQRASAPVPR